MTKGTILTITGSDSTGESGIQADIRIISDLGCAAVSVITSITVQNTIGIQDFFDLPPQVVSAQAEAIMNDVQPEVVKIGMLRNAETIDAVARILGRYKARHVIYDPVLFSSRGQRLISEELVSLIRRRIFPLCDVIAVSRSDAAELLGGENKNGICYMDDKIYHGLSNVFTSSLAVFLCKGYGLEESEKKAREYSLNQRSLTTALQGRASQLYNAFLRLLAEEKPCGENVADYAERLNVSSRYLGQVCRRIAGDSPKTIIDGHVTGRIISLLKAGDKNIQEIADILGFSSQAHLSKFFRKETGMSPSEYRKTMDKTD